ncbi:hypothetical protein IMG5_098520 [Ichthyophthirius multifiliis]|uniref:CDC20/Fizzy WD40 domain-containing protein n=1 Tax=Ichthyophthirius multifiliis TaxID=5932 RepID=G0QRY6_ICHMU|nr:hypothetical protein IMG5_098520 [Ichthyophthirius multifiliis]EGR32016.1 hypothetical protein IMG5_098520 [Ichthyophthirius multifiliis]|eukprot:XP_004035502.1 hypothetical protein IMG5_098520 [Ichthyophthirius multifiliis]
MDFTSPLKQKNNIRSYDQQTPSQFISPQSEMQTTQSFHALKTPNKYSDRYIPTRTIDSKTNFDLKQESIYTNDFTNEQVHLNVQDENTKIYNQYIQTELFRKQFETPKILQFEVKKIPPVSPFMFDQQENIPETKKRRKIGHNPIKILDAPGLADDFYIDVLDWSCQSIIGIALGQCIYTLNTQSGNINKLCENQSFSSLFQVQNGPFPSFYTSVKWNPNNGNLLAIGNTQGIIDIHDIQKNIVVRKINLQKERIGCMDFCSNGNILAAGCKDKSILVQDLRESGGKIFFGHSQEVCSIKFSPDQQYLATGGNDNKINIWNYSVKNIPFQTHSEHKAAIRALAWNPHQHGILLSGGGSNDQCIKTWNVNNNQIINNTPTGSQICKILFSENVNEFVCAHGYDNNKISVWKYNSMQKIAQLDGHNNRVLYLSISPDNTTIVSGSGDETIKFWKIFSQQVKQQYSQSMLKFTELR